MRNKSKCKTKLFCFNHFTTGDEKGQPGIDIVSISYFAFQIFSNASK